MKAFNEDTLVPTASVEQKIEAQTTVLILPIFGTIEVKNDFHTEGSFVTAGEAYFFATVDAETLIITNPYDEGIVSYLEIHLQNDVNQPFNSVKETTFDFTNAKNQLLPFFPDEVKNQNIYGFIGQYDGRNESNYTVKNPQNGIFVFVIEGVFEVQNRLLHARDGLSLCDVDAVELEALSNDAVILLLELPFEKEMTE